MKKVFKILLLLHIFLGGVAVKAEAATSTLFGKIEDLLDKKLWEYNEVIYVGLGIEKGVTSSGEAVISKLNTLESKIDEQTNKLSTLCELFAQSVKKEKDEARESKKLLTEIKSGVQENSNLEIAGTYVVLKSMHENETTIEETKSKLEEEIKNLPPRGHNSSSSHHHHSGTSAKSEVERIQEEIKKLEKKLEELQEENAEEEESPEVEENEDI